MSDYDSDDFSHDDDSPSHSRSPSPEPLPLTYEIPRLSVLATMVIVRENKFNVFYPAPITIQEVEEEMKQIKEANPEMTRRHLEGDARDALWQRRRRWDIRFAEGIAMIHAKPISNFDKFIRLQTLQRIAEEGRGLSRSEAAWQTAFCLHYEDKLHKLVMDKDFVCAVEACLDGGSECGMCGRLGWGNMTIESWKRVGELSLSFCSHCTSEAWTRIKEIAWRESAFGMKRINNKREHYMQQSSATSKPMQDEITEMFALQPNKVQKHK